MILKKKKKITFINIILDNEIKSLSHLFEGCHCIQKINFTQFYREDIINMSYLFNGCSSLYELNLSNFNTDNVTNMSYMFYGCSFLKKLNLNNFNTDNVTNMSCLFSKCEDLTSIDLSKFNTKNVSNMKYMFLECKNLKSLDISKFDINLSTDKSYMFESCYNLKKVIISKDYLEDIENSIDNKDYIKNNYYLINSLKYKFNTSDKFFGKFYHRIERELNNCLFEIGFQIFSLIDDTLTGVLEGPISTCYENGFFLFKIKFEKGYPSNPPKFYFITKIFHPNISEDGLISSNIYNVWIPAARISRLIITVQFLLGNPNSDFLNQEAGKLYKENRNIYEDTVKDYIKKYANYSIYKNKLKEYELENIFRINEN